MRVVRLSCSIVQRQHCVVTDIVWIETWIEIEDIQYFECYIHELGHTMRGRFKRKETYWKAEAGLPTTVDEETPGELSPSIRESSSSGVPESPVSVLVEMSLDDGHQKSPNCTKYGIEKRYLGVRVKMPVKDMLRNIRLAKGCDDQELQEKIHKRSKGEKKRVNTCKDRRNSKRKLQNKSLEELAIIVEVLEEDLKMGNTCSSLRPSANSNPSSTLLLSIRSMESSNNAWTATPTPYSKSLCSNSEQGHLSTSCSASNLGSPSNDCMSDGGSSDCLSQLLPSPQQCKAGYHSTEDSDDMIPSPKDMTAFTLPISAELCQAALCLSPGFANPSYDLYRYENVGSHEFDSGGLKTEWLSSQNCVGQRSSAYFLSQLQREEKELQNMSDNMLLASDEHGRMALHRVVCIGKRAQGYAIAKRMLTINCLDLKDSKGMTALHLAAKHNQHLIVADLIGLGANPNEKDASGKTCLHICAESGYIRVLEVLKDMMSDGVFVDMDATDNYGLTVLQCAALGLSTTVRELEGSASLGQARLHTLRKDQMMETLECLLQMDINLPRLGSAYTENVFDVHCEREPGQFTQGLKCSITKGNPVTNAWPIL